MQLEKLSVPFRKSIALCWPSCCCTVVQIFVHKWSSHTHTHIHTHRCTHTLTQHTHHIHNTHTIYTTHTHIHTHAHYRHTIHAHHMHTTPQHTQYTTHTQYTLHTQLLVTWEFNHCFMRYYRVVGYRYVNCSLNAIMLEHFPYSYQTSLFCIKHHQL